MDLETHTMKFPVKIKGKKVIVGDSKGAGITEVRHICENHVERKWMNESHKKHMRSTIKVLLLMYPDLSDKFNATSLNSARNTQLLTTDYSGAISDSYLVTNSHTESAWREMIRQAQKVAVKQLNRLLPEGALELIKGRTNTFLYENLLWLTLFLLTIHNQIGELSDNWSDSRE